ncbi:hypothetical protein [Sulfitobacter pontiacus]|uniref:hypothetical protein n=1 Tax=Sulfitobacter pontiacus TaxID=60137 RepID=UPI0030EB4DD8
MQKAGGGKTVGGESQAQRRAPSRAAQHLIKYVENVEVYGGDEEIRVSADIVSENYIYNAKNLFSGFSNRSECVAKCVASNCPAIPSGNLKKRWHEWQD